MASSGALGAPAVESPQLPNDGDVRGQKAGMTTEVRAEVRPSSFLGPRLVDVSPPTCSIPPLSVRGLICPAAVRGRMSDMHLLEITALTLPEEQCLPRECQSCRPWRFPRALVTPGQPLVTVPGANLAERALLLVGSLRIYLM